MSWTRAKDLELIENENGRNKLILFFYIVPWVVDKSGIEKNHEVCIILTQEQSGADEIRGFPIVK